MVCWWFEVSCFVGCLEVLVCSWCFSSVSNVPRSVFFRVVFLFLAWCFGGRNSYVLLLDLNGVLGPSTASPKLHPYSAAHVKRVIRLPNHFPI